eukprot:CAMPEP_0184362156 /NCGR_PEP_ID=MMETSP1089-20130417/133598_1 /TAXON_ID=38269 ORGANISM="Gloeochaete wittrockiana, Strain SAG46.84" /NCGR_SAMPLE_ID=MMETSP1089 /ASSEMBLY_ACC=CAM_ASM_000445 /LENGTH=36 /DNA_ID= /DNA_START= /DNA_END= /DNA_ORIENTATION=
MTAQRHLGLLISTPASDQEKWKPLILNVGGRKFELS